MEAAMVRDMWETRDRPLLEAIAAAEEDGHTVERPSKLFGTAGLSEPEVLTGLKALYKDGLVYGIDASSLSGFDMLEIELSGDGRRAVGSWPSRDPYVDLIRLLEARVAATSDTDERTRLQRMLGSVRDLGSDVVANLIATLIARQAGM
jgi:hypothetical protein